MGAKGWYRERSHLWQVAHGLLETWMGVIQNLRRKTPIGNDKLDARLYESTQVLNFRCWPCQICNLINLVLEKVASTIWIYGAALLLALLPPTSFKTGSSQVEPVSSEFKLWREGVRYTVEYDINYLLMPTLNLKKNHRIVICWSSSSDNHNSHLSQILNDTHPRF